MKKTLITLITFASIILNWSCSNEEEIYTNESVNMQKNFTNNNGGNQAPSIEGCEVIFTFYSPNLSIHDKNQIRNSFAPHFFISSYTTLNSSQETWNTNCQDLTTFITNHNDDTGNNPNNGPCIPQKGCLDKCQTSTCSTSGDKDENPIDDPFN